MGNRASLFITIDSGNEVPIIASKSLKGKVLLTIHQGKFPAADLNLRLTGTEYTILPSRKGTKREEKTIARAFTRLKGFGGTRNISKGVYSQPFEFLLPASLPSSTQFPQVGSKNFHGRIQYLLSAKIGELRFERVFYVVSAPLAGNVVPCIANPTTHELRQAKLLKKGFLSIGACVDNSHVGRGQSLKVSVSSRNNSSCNIERVRVRLVELIEYKAQDEKNVLKNVLVDIKDVNLSALRRHWSEDNLLMSRRRFSETMETTYGEILSDLESGQNTFQVTIPKSARDTYNGNLISISHYLKITYYTQLTVWENPSTKIPVVIGTPRVGSQSETPIRGAHEPIATIVSEEPLPSEMPDPCDESTVEVGYDIPMVEARILPPPDQSPNTVYPMDTNVTHGPARILPYCSDDDDENDDRYQFRTPPRPLPSAPHESLLMRNTDSRSSPRDILGRHARLGGSSPYHYLTPLRAYAPYAIYNNNNNVPPRDRIDSIADNSIAESSYQQEPLRDRIESYSYDDTSVSAESQRIPQYCNPEQFEAQKRPKLQQLFDQLLNELRASIHDYEVVWTKSREPEYRELYSSLSPKQLGQIVATVSMSYQVQIAVLLARHLVYTSSFSCAHCAEAVNKTSNYFRTNMVESLLPYIHDLSSNKHLIESVLSEWERCVTQRAFEGLV